MPEVSYPPGAVVRRVGPVGDVRYRSARIMVGRGLAGETVQVVEREAEVEIHYGNHRVRRLSANERRRDTRL